MPRGGPGAIIQSVMGMMGGMGGGGGMKGIGGIMGMAAPLVGGLLSSLFGGGAQASPMASLMGGQTPGVPEGPTQQFPATGIGESVPLPPRRPGGSMVPQSDIKFGGLSPMAQSPIPTMNPMSGTGGMPANTPAGWGDRALEPNWLGSLAAKLGFPSVREQHKDSPGSFGGTVIAT